MGWFSSGKTNVVKAAKKGDLAGVDRAIAEGADANSRTLTRMTPLMFAAERGHRDLVRRLLAAKADPSTVDMGGMTPVTHAARWGHAEIVHDLLEAIADPLRRSSNAQNAFFTLVDAVLFVPTPAHADCVRAMIQTGFDVHGEDDKGRLPLVVAAGCGYADIVAALLEGGADVNRRDGGGSTTVMVAAANDRDDVIRLLAAAGADLDARAEKSIGFKGVVSGAVESEISDLTALMLAGLQGRRNAAVALIQAGADTSLKASDGNTAYDLAAMRFQVMTAAAMEEATKARVAKPEIPAS